MIPIDLSNKIAVITGGSGALGRVMVRTLAEAGADIAICYYRDQETAHLLQDEITAKGVPRSRSAGGCHGSKLDKRHAGCCLRATRSGRHHRQ